MKRKVNLLITFASIILVALCLVQYYLVKTTYQYKVAQFKSEVKDKLSKITNDYTDVDSTIFYKKDALYKQLAENYIENKKLRNDVKLMLLQNKYKKELAKKLQAEFKNEIPNLSIDFAIILNKFVIYNNATKADTIFAEQPLIGNKMCGDLTSLKDAFLIRNYVGTTSSTNSKLNYKLLTEDALYVSVKGWEMIVLKRMTLILIFALFSIITLISIFIITIKALIKQKKISDIKTDFINNITHELKTPLTTLAVSTKILERKDIRENEVVFNQLVSTINRQNNRLQNLIDQVMSNSLGDEEIQLHKETIKANKFIATIVDDFEIANPTVSIKKKFVDVETNLVLDAFHLTTAINNVLENAVKYGSTTIFITTSLENNLYKIAIEDNGIGVAKNQHNLLFDKFYRVKQGNLHNAKGLGLGLYYVKQIINAHKGSISLVSDLGKGTAFTITIPV